MRAAAAGTVTRACNRPRTSSSSRRRPRARRSLSAAGDTGDDECNSSRPLVPLSGQNLLSLLDPGSQPYVLSVGGTTIDDATQPASEHVWDDGAQWGAGGGGISESWAMPSWQQPLANTAANAVDVANAEAFESASAKESAPFTTPTFCDADAWACWQGRFVARRRMSPRRLTSSPAR